MSDRQTKIIILILALCHFLLTLFLCWFKYSHFLYNALDLAIFNQVFYYSSLGEFFKFTIHSTSYLGDHFTPILFLLLPLYLIYKSPLNLVFLQTLILSLGVWPLYLIAMNHSERREESSNLNQNQILFICALYLFNPLTLGVSLFEFHFLPFAIFFGLWAFYLYQKEKFWPFLIFILLCLITTEDVSFLVFCFGLLALIEKKKIKWILTPIILSTSYFFLALKIISYYATDSSYKFLIYYSWLGQNIPEIIKNSFFRPDLVIFHLATASNLELILGVLMSFLFLPLLRPKYLILILPTLLEFTLSIDSGTILKNHYASLFVLVLAIASIFALKYLNQLKIYQKIKADLIFGPALFLFPIVSIIYLQISLGPYTDIYKYLTSREFRQQTEIKADLVSQVPADASLITGYDFLPNVSNRKKLYLLNYIFIGSQQYSKKPYEYEITDYALIDFNDFIDYQLQYKNNSLYNYQNGEQNFKNLIENYQLVEIKDMIALFKKSNQIDPGLFNRLKELPNLKKPLTGDFNGYLAIDNFGTAQQVIISNKE